MPLEQELGEEQGWPMSGGCWFLHVPSGAQKAPISHCVGGSQQMAPMVPQAMSSSTVESLPPPPSFMGLPLSSIPLLFVVAHDSGALAQSHARPSRMEPGASRRSFKIMAFSEGKARAPFCLPDPPRIVDRELTVWKPLTPALSPPGGERGRG